MQRKFLVLFWERKVICELPGLSCRPDHFLRFRFDNSTKY